MRDLKEISSFISLKIPQMIGMLNLPTKEVDILEDIRRIIHEWKEYKDLEEQGKLLKLPCKVGDVVWCVGNKFILDYEIRRIIFTEIGIDCFQISKEVDGKEYWNNFSPDDLGKTVFLTQEEAEAALKEVEHE